MNKSLVLGFFDGVHKGHRAVIESALKISGDVSLITFRETPAVYFGKNAEYILPREESIKKIKELGVKEVVELDFPKIVSQTAKKYLEYLINTYHPISISTGFNHTFGFNKEGNTDFLETNKDIYNYNYICIPPIKDNDKIISSSLIKNLLTEGNVEYANYLLESNFTLEGKVIHGAKLGRTIGFPTANINYTQNLVKLPFGVYKTNISADNKKSKSAVMNWGMKPTVHNTVEPVVEVHILNFEGDLYGKNIKIEVLKRIRGEKKFRDLDELKVQINEDIKQCSKL